MDQSDLAARLERVEAHLAIQQLACRYAVAVDQRDLDTWVSLFVEDIDLRRYGVGREALRAWIDPMLRRFYRSMHRICGHVIEIVDREHATGKVYCQAEHEIGGKWVVMPICYSDTYERRDGEWFFAFRKEEHWYAADVLQRPGEPDLNGWPAGMPSTPPSLPQTRPSWAKFWAASSAEHIATLTAFPVTT